MEDGLCICDTDYYGDRCSVHCSWQEECHKHGICSKWLCVWCVRDRSGQCECVYGFSGTKCDTECNRASTCHGHGDCVGGGYCVCDAGYEGEYCEKKEADYSMVVLLFVVANVVVAFLWYRGRVGGCESVLSLLVLSFITHHITLITHHITLITHHTHILTPFRTNQFSSASCSSSSPPSPLVRRSSTPISWRLAASTRPASRSCSPAQPPLPCLP